MDTVTTGGLPMLIRPADEGSILISQPAHAWVSGQLARAWRRDETEPIEPFEEVCLAAEQHDIGWLTWESSPVLNQKTGLPFAFYEMPRREHIQIWTRARRFATTMNRYAALLISRHGTGLFERYGPRDDAPDAERDQVAGFLRRERAAQERLIEDLAGSPRYAEFLDDETLDQNSECIRIWDGISLMICGGLGDEGADIGSFHLSRGPEEGQILVDPWPFANSTAPLAVEGRLLTGRYERQIQLQAALQRVSWRTLEFELLPPESAG
jgi:hypothetical protein